ncbi:hypothetical protein B0T10DRAFT_464306 [Thelonectria olida]|uniref:Uncharacterized protein n=1 Tax=Thelonectria olida TaxID=1576542 RepID=A0A9P8VXY4_9HYPO|nr:hypothetical protein B0T10DRAFT_464306 [Thelonectria olida]
MTRKQKTKLTGAAESVRQLRNWKRDQSARASWKQLRHASRKAAKRGTLCDTCTAGLDMAHSQREPIDVEGGQETYEDTSRFQCNKLPEIIVHPPSDDDMDMESRREEHIISVQIEAQLMETTSGALVAKRAKAEIS